ncbi:hypothetical protein E2562_031608 [Oryza meyeriana var. granulata]|uniref:Uncharacterized protein n=1 Tax=Oryza meyeriana var. granulata TaxID=110450 RepID=A0A6G1CJU3_9ORYZ|nr:hypothetical protein E2562_031608 [Oryza meyeriana var. granulata]
MDGLALSLVESFAGVGARLQGIHVLSNSARGSADKRAITEVAECLFGADDYEKFRNAAAAIDPPYGLAWYRDHL